MTKIYKIIIIIQRSNGDVFLSSPLICALYQYFNKPKIDLLINEDTLSVAKTLQHINNIIVFSYKQKKSNFIKQEIKIIRNIYRKYNLSICLTSSDRSILYASLASKNSMSFIEKNLLKSWWKKIVLKKYHYFDTNKSIIINNLFALELLNIKTNNIFLKSNYSLQAKNHIKNILNKLNIKEYIIFHPSAQYKYKIYPTELRNKLIEYLNSLEIPIIITGGNSNIDIEIKKNLKKFKYIYDFINKINLEEYIALSDMSMAYIGMDTLNMHIAASQDKKIFAIFGPTKISIWSPWSNKLQNNIKAHKMIQTYDNITIFQADISCIGCGQAGCDDKGGKSKCLYLIDPITIFREVKKWLNK